MMKIIREFGKWLLLVGWIPTIILVSYSIVQSASLSAQEGRKPLKITRIYTGDDGKTHMEEYAEPLNIRRESSNTDLSEVYAAESIQFRRNSPDYFIDWHTAPRRQYVITISGESEVELADGTKIHLYPGHILLAEDTTGQGHISRAVGEEDRLSIFIPLD